MRTCGLDIASCTGIALVGEGEDRGKTLEIPKTKGFARLQLIAQNARQTLSQWGPDLVVVEHYAYCRNIDSFITIVEIGTTIKSVLWQLGLDWYEVPPTSLKKWTTGKGNADKAAMAKSVKERWAYVSDSHDVIDAFALAQMGQMGRDELLKVPGVFSGK